jgi:hypothetical protein
MDASVDERTGTHRARLQRHVNGGTVETPAVHPRRSLTQCNDFCVGRWVLVALAPVATPTQELSVGRNDHATHGDVHGKRSVIGLAQSLVHPERMQLRFT